MENPYDLHFYSEYYRQDALREARTWQLAKRAKADGGARSARDERGFTLGDAFASLLRRAKLAG